MRAVRTTNKNTLEVISLLIPSRTGNINEDFFPPFPANVPSNTAEAWVSGTDVAAKTMQIAAQKKSAVAKKGGLNRLKGKATESAAAATGQSEEVKGGEDTAALKAKIASLESQLQAAQQSSAS